MLQIKKFLHTYKFWYNSNLTRSDNKVHVSNQKVETWINFFNIENPFDGKLKLKFNYQMHFETFRKVIKHRNNWKRIFYSRHLLRSNSNSATFERGTSSQMAIWYGSTTRLAVHRESTNPAELYNYLSNERLSYFSWIQGFGSTLRTWTNVKVSRNKDLPARA